MGRVSALGCVLLLLAVACGSSSPDATSETDAATPSPTPTPIPAATPQVCTFEDTVELVSAATTLVISDGFGTAFHIGDGYFVTAAHVVGPYEEVLLESDTISTRARVLRVDAYADAALLQADMTRNRDFPHVEWRGDPEVRAGEVVGTVGYPADVVGAGSASRGVVSKLIAEGGLGFIQTDAPVNPGNSGGALFDSCGTVVGVVRSKLANVAIEGIAYAVSEGSVRFALGLDSEISTGRDTPPISTATDAAGSATPEPTATAAPTAVPTTAPATAIATAPPSSPEFPYENQLVGALWAFPLPGLAKFHADGSVEAIGCNSSGSCSHGIPLSSARWRYDGSTIVVYHGDTISFTYTPIGSLSALKTGTDSRYDLFPISGALSLIDGATELPALCGFSNPKRSCNEDDGWSTSISFHATSPVQSVTIDSAPSTASVEIQGTPQCWSDGTLPGEVCTVRLNFPRVLDLDTGGSDSFRLQVTSDASTEVWTITVRRRTS